MKILVWLKKNVFDQSSHVFIYPNILCNMWSTTLLSYEEKDREKERPYFIQQKTKSRVVEATMNEQSILISLDRALEASLVSY